MEPAPDVAIKRAAANAARIMKTAVTLGKIVDARTVPLWSKQLANSMVFYPFKPTNPDPVAPHRLAQHDPDSKEIQVIANVEKESAAVPLVPESTPGRL
jgi:hypothetical protein